MTLRTPIQSRNGTRGERRLLDRALGIAGSQRLSILIYHRVLAGADYMRPGDPTVAQFNWQMELIARHFKPLALSDALRLMSEKRLPDRSVCVTFDDGYADNQRLALPVLKKFGISATVFVSTAFLDGGRMWNDTVIEVFRRCPRGRLDTGIPGVDVVHIDTMQSRFEAAMAVITGIKYRHKDERIAIAASLAARVQELPDDLMLTTTGLRKLLSAGVEIGGHTRTHPILATLDAETAFSEIAQGKSDLEGIIGSTIRYFAYPNGKFGVDYTSEHVEMVRRVGFEHAFSTSWGVASSFSDLMQYPRFTPWDKTRAFFMARLLGNFRNLG